MNLDAKAIKAAITQICDEKGLAYESVVQTLNSALAAAYRKDFGNKNQNITFDFNLDTGASRVWDTKTVVEFPEDILKEIEENGLDKKYVKILDAQGNEIIKEGKAAPEQAEGEKKETKPKAEIPEDESASVRAVVREELGWEKEEELPEGAQVIKYNPKTDILLAEAKKIKKDSKVGDQIVTDLEIPADFGRMAAQTAKQVIIQKLREAEREAIFEEFKDKQDKLIIGIVQRREPNYVLVDFGKMSAIMPLEEQTKIERYLPGQRMKFYVVSIAKGVKGPQMIVSRSHPKMLEKLFEIEIPEVSSGAISVKGIAREAGSRAKVSVMSNEENIDPIGSCVGQRGTRIQTIIAELNGEKVDIIEYAENPEKYVSNSLSPAKVASIKVDKDSKIAIVTVKEDQLSLAIGKDGQNVRLAAKLTGWKINIMKETPAGEAEPVITSDDQAVIEAPAESALEKTAAPEIAPASVSVEATADEGKKPKEKKAKKIKKKE